MASQTIPVPAAYTQKPAELILTLIRAGWTQEQIALTVETTQATVCRIYNGRHKNPRYGIVEKLRDLVLSLDDFTVAQ